MEGSKGVGIWLARKNHIGWSRPVEVANDKRYPCWNPVLFQPKKDSQPLFLFYKVGPHPSCWWGMMMESGDYGWTWEKPVRLPDGILGPTKNKPIELPSGRIICPSSTEDHGWRVHFEISEDYFDTWIKTSPSNGLPAIQPTLFIDETDSIHAFCRSKQGKIVTTSSRDGLTWSEVTETTLPNPNSGIDGVTMVNGHHLLIYNPTSVPEGSTVGVRTPLVVARSKDLEVWKNVRTLESDLNGSYSYPSVIQTKSKKIHIVYTWKRQSIKHVVL